MNVVRMLGVSLTAAMLGGCAIGGTGYDIESMRAAKGNGNDFTQGLTEQYRQLTVYEADEMYDWTDASHFARKGLRTAAGETVEPEAIADRKLPADKLGELTQARADLVQLLAAGAREKAPQDAAVAQGRFDCWMEQQEENFQLDHIAACRDAFQASLQKLRIAMTPPATTEAAPAPQRITVFFAFDKTDVTPENALRIAEAVAAARKIGIAAVAVTGHADRAGTEGYNAELSLRRANAVRAALLAHGLKDIQVSVAGRGESEPAVTTADGTPEPANRRAEIVLVP